MSSDSGYAVAPEYAQDLGGPLTGLRQKPIPPAARPTAGDGPYFGLAVGGGDAGRRGV